MCDEEGIGKQASAAWLLPTANWLPKNYRLGFIRIITAVCC